MDKIYTIEDVNEAIKKNKPQELLKILHNSDIDLNIGNEKRHNTPLHLAASEESITLCRILIKYGADVKSDPILLKSACGRSRSGGKVIQFLIEQGAPTNEPETLDSILHHIQHRQDMDLMIFLMERGIAEPEDIIEMLEDLHDNYKPEKWFQDFIKKCNLYYEELNSHPNIKGAKK